ncbi:pancreatic lipase-related protein 2 isoform X1 [Ixodes scapularis]|uniref:pancreatic lipase-related protein 2 isoform X1 n=1 Tax=Ixodes scapularis TaxID=6945 RepID=UPI001A9CD340|nr:pancreatic lipase-related protein 2 isoform X1 [Ixodes scapularis]
MSLFRGYVDPRTFVLLVGFCTLAVQEGAASAKTKLASEKSTSRRCYGELGCFENGGVFYHSVYRPINFFPNERSEVNTQFLLFTRDNPVQEDPLSWKSPLEDIRESHFNASRETKMITHGWLDTIFFGAWMKDMKTAFLLVGDYNVIIVDWRGGNGLPYTQATANTRLVGAEISLMIEKLETVFGADPRTFHILGHSLGSHAAGYAGERLKRLGRITGMDPAEPYFEKMPKEVRIDPTDADFVDIVHTDGASFFPDVLKGEGLGLYDPVGHVDFYPNGGVKMPGCDLGSRIFKFVTEGLVGGARAMGICHHQRAIDYVIESITNKQCSSLAFECSTHEMFHKGRCSDCGSDGSRCAQMGFWADQWKRFKNDSRTRRMFLDTNADEPFCAYHYLVNVQMSKDSRSSPVTGNFFLTLEGSKGEATVKVNRRTEELYPGAKYTFLVTTPSRVGVIKKASFKYKTDKIFFKSRMFLKHVEILPMNKPTRRTQRSDRTLVFCPAATDGLISDKETVLDAC